MIEFFTLLTDIGLAKLTNAAINGVAVDLRSIAIGDGSGDYYEPTPSQIELENEVFRADLNALIIDPDNNKRFSAQIIIPESSGGYTIREAGLFDSDGDLIAVAKVPATFKPDNDSGAGAQIYFKILIECSEKANVTISITPSDLFITQEVLDVHLNDKTNPHAVTKAQVGLGNVDNVKQYSASNPPPYPVTSVASRTGNVTLTTDDISGVLPIDKGGTGNSTGTSQYTEGMKFSDSSRKYKFQDLSVANPTDCMTFGTSGIGYTPLSTLKTALNLGNVNNTTDLAKPISTATQNALNGKQPLSNIDNVILDSEVSKYSRWKRYQNGHAIIDASAGVSPNGSAISDKDVGNTWVHGSPTLMGWNGSQTYGVRVDNCRLADHATTVDSVSASNFFVWYLDENIILPAGGTWKVVAMYSFDSNGHFVASVGTGGVRPGGSSLGNYSINRNKTGFAIRIA